MKKALLSGATLLFIAAAVFAQVPKSPDQVPAYPGATVVSEKQGPAKEEISSGKAPNWIFALERISTTTASVEQVAQFYAGTLGVPVEQEGGADPRDLEPGQVSSVGSGVDWWDQGWIDESADAVKAGFQKRARLPGAETWISGAGFEWAYKNAEKDPWSFKLIIADRSVTDEDPTHYVPLTEIRLTVHMINQEKMLAQQEQRRKDEQASAAMTPQQYKAAQQAWADEIQARNKAFETENAKKKAEADLVRAEMAKAPTEKLLGVPIYPGARYQAEPSQDRTSIIQGAGRMYVFEAAAALDAVVQFYVTRTGNKVAATNEIVDTDFKVKLITVPINFGKPPQKGDAPPVKDTVTVGGPTNTGTTVIMILKRPADWTAEGPAGR